MNDLYWFLIMMLFMEPHEQKEERTIEMNELKNTFKETIEKKLSNPDITPKEIQELACAYSELTKNDWMKEFTNRASGLGMGFGGPVGSENAQLVNTREA